MYKLLGKLGDFEYVLRLADQTYIPFDDANPLYQEFVAWIMEGNEPEPAEEPPVPPGG